MIDILAGHALGTFWYSAQHKVALINIPKHASTTLKEMFRRTYADAACLNIYTCMGLLLDTDIKWYVYRRDEFDRYLSGIVEFEIRNCVNVHILVSKGHFVFDEHTMPSRVFLLPFTSCCIDIRIQDMDKVGIFKNMAMPIRNPSKDPDRVRYYQSVFESDPYLLGAWSEQFA